MKGNQNVATVSGRDPISPWVNPVTRALRQGKVSIGSCSVAFPSAAAAQVFAVAGFSWHYVEMEHSQASYADIAHVCAASKLAGIVPIAGPTSLEDHLIARPLDAGAMGVVAPHVDSAEQAEQVVKWAKYPPIGKRGLIHLSDLTEFEMVDPAAWVESQNKEILAAVKVESGKGIDEIEAIAAVPGLDAILIGPGDLSATLGIPGQTSHPHVRDCIQRMLDAVKRHGIAGGPHVGTPEEIADWSEKGATFMAYSFDAGMLLETAMEDYARTEALLGDRLL